MSKQSLSPYINFQGRAREAMEFYHRLLGGTLDLQTFDQKGAPKPAGPGDSISHSRLETDGVVIMGSDGNPAYPAKVGENVAIALMGTDKDHLTKVFNGLAEGGQLKMPLTDQSWGASMGWLMDRFGINWMVNIDKE
jgi:PhnB protein